MQASAACRAVDQKVIAVIRIDSHRAQRLPALAVLLRNQRGQVAGFGQRLDELGGVRLARFEAAPVRAPENWRRCGARCRVFPGNHGREERARVQALWQHPFESNLS